MTTTAMIAANAARWSKAKLTRGSEFTPVASRLIKAKTRYQAVSAQTGVPWFVIAVIHERESSQSWSGSLAQGDPWNQVSTHVPKGRGPFKSWEDAAIDALKVCAPYAANWKDWTPGGTLTLLELYNGTGYASKGLPSPYVWSGTDQYRIGKYVADDVFDPNVVDKQLGCAGLIMSMAIMDTSVVMTGQIPVKPAPTPVPPPPDIQLPPPVKLPATKGPLAVALALLLGAIGSAAAAIKSHPNWTAAAVVCAVAAVIAIVIHHKRKSQ